MKKFSKGNSVEDLKSRLFLNILNMSVITFAIVGIVNQINQRPLVNVLYPIIASVLVGGMLYIYKKNHFRKLIKNIYFSFLCFVYFPTAWLTSPGSFSAMPFYAILILFVCVMLTEKKYEVIYPISVFIQTIILFNFEPLRPEQFSLYSEANERAVDLSMNYFIVGLAFFLIILTLNRYVDEEHSKIYNASITDHLTGLYNRRHLLSVIDDIINNSNEVFSILMMDLNNFKKVNDSFGHFEGDEVLKEFAKILKNASRKDDLCFRYGGDEFVIILPRTNIEEAKKVEERIAISFSKYAKKYKDIDLSVGIGIADSSFSSTIDEIIQIADDHLYNIKNNSKSK